MRYAVLGSLELRAAGTVVPLGGERQRKLLAVLLLSANSVVPHGRLIDELWPDPPPTARRQVANAAAGVRRVVGDCLVTTPHGYLVRASDDELDLAVFRALVGNAVSQPPEAAARLLGDALKLWRGPLLDGLDSPMINAVRSGLAEQRLTAVERYAEAAAEVADVEAVIGELVALVAEYPLRESLRATLMRALRRVGRHADALEVFEQGHRLLAEQLGVDPGPVLRAAHDEVLRADQDQDPGPARPSTVLPPENVHFVGRTAVIGRVLSLVSSAPSSHAPVIVLEGMGGVGKTSLAVRVADLMRDRYPDGVRFVDLRGFTEGEPPMPVHVALETLLWQSGMPANRVAAEPAARLGQWRKAAEGKRLLLVLDNVASAAQARPLLTGVPGSLVLVTSRRHLVDMDDAVPVPVDVLEPPEAAELFRRIAADGRVEAEPGATEAVVRLCGHLPLALRIAAARFRRRPGWTMAYLAEQLSDRRGRDRTFTGDDDGVSATITLSYRDLPPRRQRIFRLLGVVPGPDFDTRAVAAMAAVPPAEARDALESLFERSLVLERGPDRYALHDLVRDYVRARSADEDTEAGLRAAFGRLAGYYAWFAKTQCAALAAGRPMPRIDLDETVGPVTEPVNPAEAIARLRTDYANLVAATEHASERGWWEHTWQLPCLLLPYFISIGQRTGVGALAERAVSAARHLRNPRAEAYALLTSAFALGEQGRHEQVRELIESAVRLSEAGGDLATAAVARRDLGGSALEAGRLDEAEQQFLEARQLADAAGDKDCAVGATGDLALTLAQAGRHGEARLLFEAALRHHRSEKAVGREAVTLINLGWLHHLDGDDTSGLAALQRALPLSRAAGYIRAEVTALAWLAVTHRRLGNLGEAIAAGLQACEAAGKSEMQESECEALNGLGEAYVAAGRSVDAVPVFERAERIASTGDLPMALARAWEGLAHVAAGQGDHEQAARLWERALNVYPRTTPDADQPRAHLAAPGDPDARCTRCQARPAEVRPPAEQH
ncbi:BTAD domain-containing putative transcriptional regulator [Amycolatopsis sp. NPDC051758]|uniref:AfsR/SARP family transcriptional regulator n=1 Tax=Amycolatopsis sp. NPDC051758 TaxID=3363935 RepID=UPI00378F40B5